MPLSTQRKAKAASALHQMRLLEPNTSVALNPRRLDSGSCVARGLNSYITGFVFSAVHGQSELRTLELLAPDGIEYRLVATLASSVGSLFLSNDAAQAKSGFCQVVSTVEMSDV